MASLTGLIDEVRRRCPAAAASELHGDRHWRCVVAAGLRLVEGGEDADTELVFLFGLLHDSQRWDDGYDIDHGPRAAEFVLTLAAEGRIALDARRLELLAQACRDHTRGRTATDATVGVCWDADRLNLHRVGIAVDAGYLSTRTATDPQIMRWAAALHAAPPSWDDLLSRRRAAPAGTRSA